MRGNVSQRGLTSDERELLLCEAERTANIGTWAWDLATNEVVWSRELFRILGYDPDRDRASADAYFAAIHPDDRERLREVARQNVATGTSRATESRVLHPDGQIREVITDGVPIYEEGRLVRFVGTVLDMTERRAAERALRRSEAMLNEAQSIAHVGSWSWDLQTDAVEWSQELYRIFGVDPSEAPTRERFMALVLEEDRAGVLQNVDRALRDRLLDPNEYRIRRAGDGAIRHCADRSRPVTDDQGRVVGFVGTVLDITERILLEAQLRQAQKMEALGRLAGGVAHDFNNLLMVIQGHAELLARGEGEGGDDVRVILQAARTGAEVTRSLLAFSRQAPRAPVLMDVNDVVADVMKLTGRLIGEDVRLSLVSERPLPPVRVDPGQIQQVLINLALNARDAMPAGGALRVSTSRRALAEGEGRKLGGLAAGDYVVIEVADTGVGMDEATRARVFEPFFTTKGKGQGTGLGLSIVYSSVRQSGGAIELESTPGAGSTFRVFLPAAGPTAEVAPDGGAAGEASPRTILLVEDDVLVADLVARVLRGAGHVVYLATTAGQADQLWQAHAPAIDLLLADVVMPDRDGRETARRYRAARPDLRVLLMSGFAPEQTGGTTDAQAGWLEKPFSRAELLAQVQRVLARGPR